MIIYWILQFFDTIITFVFSIVPVIETPAWLVSNLPKIFTTAFGFNQYLPLTEAFAVAVFLISFTMQYKIFKILLNKFGIDLTK